MRAHTHASRAAGSHAHTPFSHPPHRASGAARTLAPKSVSKRIAAASPLPMPRNAKPSTLRAGSAEHSLYEHDVHCQRASALSHVGRLCNEAGRVCSTTDRKGGERAGL
jgi:hypothetical protein